MRPKIISGGQTGADQGGLYAARRLGIPTGGYAPYGWITDAGPAPWLEDYGLVEMPVGNEYRQRTIKNVWSSNAVLWFGNPSSPGGTLTVNEAKRVNVPLRVCHFPNRLMGFEGDVTETGKWITELLLVTTEPERPDYEFTLMVAGNRERKAPGICEQVTDYMTALFREVKCPA